MEISRQRFPSIAGSFLEECRDYQVHKWEHRFARYGCSVPHQRLGVDLDALGSSSVNQKCMELWKLTCVDEFVAGYLCRADYLLTINLHRT